MPNNIFGLHFQRGDPQDLAHMDLARLATIKFVGNAVDEGLATWVRDHAPNGLRVFRLADPAEADYNQNPIDWVNKMCARLDRLNFLGLVDAVEVLNEPVIRNVDEAKALSEFQFNCNALLKSRGYKTIIAYSFSVGNPADLGLWQYLYDGLRTASFLGLHEYNAPRMDYKPEFTALRHRKVYEVVPITYQLPILLTECGIDLWTNGYQQGGGGYRNTVPPTTISDYVAQLKWWLSELDKDPYIKGVHLYGYGLLSPWVGMGFDVAQDEGDRSQFQSFVAGLPVVTEKITAIIPPIVIEPPIVIPPVEPPGETMITSQEIRDAMPFLVKQAIKRSLGQSIYGEYSVRALDGDVYHLWAWEKGGVGTKDGKYTDADVFTFDVLNGEINPIAQPPPVIIPPPSGVPPFDPSTAVAPVFYEETVPLNGLPFYRVVGMTVLQGVGAYCYVTVQNKDGSGKIGVRVVNQWYNSTNGEQVVTDGAGIARFQFGSSSSVPDPASGRYPFSFAVTLDGFKDNDAKVLHIGTILSDWVRNVGDFQSEHTQVSIQFRQVA